MRNVLVLCAIAYAMTLNQGKSKDALIASPDSGQIEFMRTVKRKTYSEVLQIELLRSQRAYFISVSGPSFCILQITAASMDNSVADELQYDVKNIERWKELGFENVELSDGQGRSWSIKLK